jgi:hypothetical protein
MVAIAHRPISRPVLLAAESNAPTTTEMLPASGAAARALARCYLRYVSAVWRGDVTLAAFAAWLDAYWDRELPPVPASMPDAISPHGGGGHGICWFETADEIRGYVSGTTGGFRVPLGAVRHAEELAPPDTGWRRY